jgi:hypothetical protein
LAAMGFLIADSRSRSRYSEFRLPVPRFIEGSISCTAEKVGAIELIHLPESLHFVELEVAGKPDYYADQLDIPLGLFLAPRRAQ